ncbi:MAG: NAD(P)-dependent oxidoreductase [Nitrospirae bacterium]|nr:NAD(P)-dependent oxidoreductase [Nitrospirota bacterium]
MRVLITGCHGFVGSSVGLCAARAGHGVMGVGLSAQPPTGWPGAYRQMDVAFSDLAAPVRDFQPDMVLHAAGSASVGGSYQAPVDDLRAAVMTWANTLDGVRRSGLAPLVVFPSSAAVYGNPDTLPVREDAPISPISPYGFHKAAGELVAREYAACFGLNVVVARLFSVYGPRQRRLLLWELYERAVGPEAEVVLHGTGGESRDYLHVDDLAGVLLELGAVRPAGLTMVNVASGRETRTIDLARMVVAAVGCAKPVRPLGQAQTGNPVNWRADVSALNSLVPVAVRPLEEGIGACVRAWR